MANAKYDQNYKHTQLAVTDDTDQTPARLLVEPITGRLEIEITPAELFNDFDVAQRIDENFNPAAEAGGEAKVKPLKCDSSGLLIIDLIVE